MSSFKKCFRSLRTIHAVNLTIILSYISYQFSNSKCFFLVSLSGESRQLIECVLKLKLKSLDFDFIHLDFSFRKKHFFLQFMELNYIKKIRN